MALMSTPPPLLAFNTKDLMRSNPEKSRDLQAKSNSKDDPTKKFPLTTDFEQLIQEIDQDISCFDHSEAPLMDISGPYTNSNPSPATCTLAP